MPVHPRGLGRAYLLSACLGLITLTLSAQPAVETYYGRVVGETSADGTINIFRGIPFARPPIDSLRWRAPEPPDSWTGTKVCTTFAASPMQRSPEPFSMWSEEFLIPKEPIGEDCLYLNVWSRAGATQQPVLVWIYGGGFNSGGSAVPIYDGEAMAREGVVFVSINYRVGPFGFLAHPELSAEAPYGSSGNYGLLDQIAALHWVRDNIAAFGGDPNRITIAGQSAGAASVNALVASPLSYGLFHRAIAESGGLLTREPVSLAAAEDNGLRFADSLGGTDLEAMRALPAATIQATPAPLLRPILDGYVLPLPVAELLGPGRAREVELLTGWNENEGLLPGPLVDAAAYRARIRERYPDRAEEYLSYYPATNDSIARRSQEDAARDALFGIQNYGWSNLHAGYSDRPVYLYRFTRRVPGEGKYADYGAFHTGEVPYAYGNLDRVDRRWTPVDHELSETMRTYWVNFVKHGNPNGVGLPAWPAYSAARKEVMLLGDRVRAELLPDAERLDFMFYLQSLDE
ncbi:para-nitrobenzyl esterase [Neolewinella xylanilytica]|uniref:Carboxylic ester hydrolase n=1 Tax=Neolewinella xylanilytica TaxID=1514080 RepID=A0A2S6IA96_9BACT|nr:carboxylesterase family protein [Neolewinella xylanilytica]PPK88421.1 para-nitrobenzyl esterase [Neolewinella xylanilytica]